MKLRKLIETNNVYLINRLIHYNLKQATTAAITRNSSSNNTPICSGLGTTTRNIDKYYSSIFSSTSSSPSSSSSSFYPSYNDHNNHYRYYTTTTTITNQQQQNEPIIPQSFLKSSSLFQTYNNNTQDSLIRNRIQQNKPILSSSTTSPVTNKINQSSSCTFLKTKHPSPSIRTTTNLVSPPSSTFHVTLQRRSFHSNLPNYFIWSKTIRIVLPIAMTGLRQWINQGNKTLRFGITLMVISGLVSIYVYFNTETTPITGRLRFIGLTPDEESELGNMSYEMVMAEHGDKLLPDNNKLQSQVRLVAKKLIENLDNPPPLVWECHVVNSDQVNAFVLPTGKIFVYSGLFQIVKTEEDLAAVLSHEIGHALARHSAEHMSLYKFGIVLLTLTRGLIGDTITGNLTTLLSTRLLELSYSRLQEIEADIIGLGILQRSGFNVEAAIRIQERLGALGEESEDDIYSNMLSTHPRSSQRIAEIKKWISENPPSHVPSIPLTKKQPSY